MKYVSEFRSAEAAKYYRNKIAELAQHPNLESRTLKFMEVCGSHTVAISKAGIRSILPDNIKLISGPGCPVCVTDTGYIDAAIELANKANTEVVTFGDMLKVPGSSSTLATERAKGAGVHVCYSPNEILSLALDEPEKQFVFLAIGFETTTAPIVAILDKVISNNIKNISFLTAFKTVPPIMNILCSDPTIRLDGFILPAHVSAIIGSDIYKSVLPQYNLPGVVAGFEALDILMGVVGLVQQSIEGSAVIENQYSRVVKPEGNKKAQTLMAKYLEPVDVSWRGFGVLPKTGLGFRGEFKQYDAEQRFSVKIQAGKDHSKCRCGEVLKGVVIPTECKLFGGGCTPEHPMGPCMVSSEGTCSAYFRFENISS